MDIYYKHTWRISKRAWYIRLYLWVWEAKEADISFCKLWWGYVFMWLALPIRLVLCAYDWTKRTSIRAANWIKRTSVRVANLFTVSREREEVLVDLAPKPVQRDRYVARYPGERVGDRSAVGEFLTTLVKSLRGKTDMNTAVGLDPVPEPESAMPRLLEGIATGAASLSMKGRAVTYAIRQGVRRTRTVIYRAAEAVVLVLMGALFLVGGALRVVLVKPVAYGSGGLAAFVMCTGKLCWMCVDRSLPYVDRMFTLLGKATWFSLWPVRKTLSWADRYLDKAGTIMVILWGLITVVCYVGGMLYVVGVSILLHPVIVLLILASFGVVVGLCIGLGFLIAYVMEKWFAPLFFREVIQPTWKGVERGTDTLQAGTVGFGRIMLIGFKSVKSNTCPKIEVEE